MINFSFGSSEGIVDTISFAYSKKNSFICVMKNMDYDFIAESLTKAINSFEICNEEVTDGCRYELLDFLSASIHSLQNSLYVLLNSYDNWQVSLDMPSSKVARFIRVLNYNPCDRRERRERSWFK